MVGTANVTPVAVPSAEPMAPVLYNVAWVRRETRDTYTLHVAPKESPARTPYLPGQFNMLYAFGIGEVPISISALPDADGVMGHTVRDVGPVTQALTRLKKGDVVGLRGPFGTNWSVEQARGSDVVIIAGGIGLAPLRPVVHSILAQRSDFGKVALIYGARTPAEVLYPREISRWRSRGIEARVTVDRSIGPWEGEVGVVTRLIPRASFDPQNCLVMVCGPEVMMRFTVTELHKLGIPDDRIFISMERNMKCSVGLCGHCQLGPYFICKDGPVFSYSQMRDWFWKKEV